MAVTAARDLRFDLERAGQILPASQFCSTSELPSGRAPRLISAMAYAPSLEQSFSGSTYYLAKAGLDIGHLEGMFSLYSAAKPWRRLQAGGLLWKVSKLLKGQKSQGFKFSSGYLDPVWARYLDCLAGTAIINNFQLYGEEFFKRRAKLDIGAHFYIDGTLAEYFDSYGDFDVAGIDSSTRKEALKLEKAGYEHADSIVAMSARTVTDLNDRYGIPLRKISVIPPGANLPDAAVEAAAIDAAAVDAVMMESGFKDGGDFILGFVGLYPLRKGLDRLAAAMQILRGQGLRLRLRVIGNCPDDLKGVDGMDYLGVVNKRTDTARFIDALSGVHLGCLLSKAELTGIAMLEFLRLGIPVLGTDVGGGPEILGGGGGLMVSPNIGTDELVELLRRVYHDRAFYATLKKEANSRRRWASWSRVAQELNGILP